MGGRGRGKCGRRGKRMLLGHALATTTTTGRPFPQSRVPFSSPHLRLRLLCLPQPIAFKDIGKLCSDLLTKDFKTGTNTVEVKSTVSNGIVSQHCICALRRCRAHHARTP